MRGLDDLCRSWTMFGHCPTTVIKTLFGQPVQVVVVEFSGVAIGFGLGPQVAINVVALAPPAYRQVA